MTGTGTEASLGELERLVSGQHHDPHSILGAHSGPDGVVVRALRPLARSVTLVLDDGRRVPMTHLYQGVFTVTLPDEKVPDYRIATSYSPDEEDETVAEDPYRFLPLLSEYDLYLIGEGRHEELWQVLGAHVREVGQVTGASFAVWAPNARGVRVTGDFNYWDGRAFPMRSLGVSGVWELFIPGVADGARYKFAVCGFDGVWRDKADPLARYAERPPATASVVFTSRYAWEDESWMAARPSRTPVSEPMSIYEVHLGSWRPGLSYRELADQLVSYVVDLGFTHVEFLPVAEHPFGGSWGYQVTSYYAPTSRFGDPDDFRHLVDALHQAGVGVLLDWVPAHFPRDEWALARFDGTALYEHPDPRRGAHPDWGTLIFNFGRTEVRNFLVANAVYWLEEFHIDGLRVDAVASMLYLDYSRKPGEWAPNQYGGRENLDAISFLQEANATCYKRVPGITMTAEESTAWPGVSRPVYLGGLGFGFKWNLGWMHDTLSYMSLDPIYRQYHHNEMTFSMVYAYTENFVLPLSHDEVVHGKGSLLGKMPGDEWRRFAGLRSLLAYHVGPPGQAAAVHGVGVRPGQRVVGHQGAGLVGAGLRRPPGRAAAVPRPESRLQAVPGALAARRVAGRVPLDRRQRRPGQRAVLPALPGCRFPFPCLRRFSCLRRFPRLRHFPCLRLVRLVRDPGGSPGVIACIANFSAVPHLDYKVGLPAAGRWREVINTDAIVYGGSGIGNLGGIEAQPEPWHGLPASASITVPPLGVLWLTPEE